MGAERLEVRTREFDSTGPSVPERHYMVDVSDRVAQIRAMVERADCFCINRARTSGFIL